MIGVRTFFSYFLDRVNERKGALIVFTLFWQRKGDNFFKWSEKYFDYCFYCFFVSGVLICILLYTLMVSAFF